MFRKRIINVFQMLVIVGLLNLSQTAFGESGACNWCDYDGTCNLCEVCLLGGGCSAVCGDVQLPCGVGCGGFQNCCDLGHGNQITTVRQCCQAMGGVWGCPTFSSEEIEYTSEEVEEPCEEDANLEEVEEEAIEETEPSVIDSLFIKFLAMIDDSLSTQNSPPENPLKAHICIPICPPPPFEPGEWCCDDGADCVECCTNAQCGSGFVCIGHVCQSIE